METNTISIPFSPLPKNHWILDLLKPEDNVIKLAHIGNIHNDDTVKALREETITGTASFNAQVLGKFEPITMDSELEEGYDGDPPDQYGSDDVNG